MASRPSNAHIMTNNHVPGLRLTQHRISKGRHPYPNRPYWYRQKARRTHVDLPYLGSQLAPESDMHRRQGSHPFLASEPRRRENPRKYSRSTKDFFVINRDDAIHMFGRPDGVTKSVRSFRKKKFQAPPTPTRPPEESSARAALFFRLFSIYRTSGNRDCLFLRRLAAPNIISCIGQEKSEASSRGQQKIYITHGGVLRFPPLPTIHPPHPGWGVGVVG